MSDNLTDIWADRRVRIGYETAEELAHKFNDFNWRGHPESQADALDDSLETLHWVGSVKVNISTNRIFDGHLRVKRALVKNPSMPIPVDYYDLTEDEELLALTIHDAITEQAEPIPDKFAALLERTREMTADRPGLGAMLERLRERAGINGYQKTEDKPPPIDKAAELQKVWGTEVGQIWQLGNHRLAVGDCTDRATVEAVMRGERAEACITDPPYGVTGQKWDRLFNQADLDVMLNNSTDIAIAFNAAKPEIVKNILSLEPIPKRIIIWRTNRPTIGGGMFWTWQPIYIWKKDLEGWDSYEWDATPTTTGEHPTQKPVDFMQRLINMIDGDIFDPFLGSGTTLIACENLNRRCRGVEIDPGYCAVTLERWQQLTGQTPRRVSG